MASKLRRKAARLVAGPAGDRPTALQGALLPTDKLRAAFDGTKLTRVADDLLITIDGRTGIFTPLTKDLAASDAPSAQNLAQVVELLKDEVASLRQRSLDLEARLADAVQKPARTPDDFATAIKHSVDSLQSRLSEMTNPVSNFVVREFAIEAKVHVDVTALGTVDYRFVQPGDAIDPARLSTLSLTIVPVPKPSTIGSFVVPEFTPQTAVEEVQGIGEKWSRHLNQHGIYTVGDLVTAGTRVKSQVQLAALLEIDRRRLTDWLGQAQLLTIKDIDGRSAEVLVKAGVGDLQALAGEEPAALAVKFNAQAVKKREGKVAPIDDSIARIWISTARAWTGAHQAPAVAPPSTPAPTP